MKLVWNNPHTSHAVHVFLSPIFFAYFYGTVALFRFRHVLCVRFHLHASTVLLLRTRRRTYVPFGKHRRKCPSALNHEYTNRHSDGIDRLTVATVTAQRLVTAAADSNYKPTHANERFSFHYLELFLSLEFAPPSASQFSLYFTAALITSSNYQWIET